jgi:hypothetical protein
MARNDNRNSRLVYSTEHGRTCPACNQKLDRCTCRKKTAPPVRGRHRQGRAVNQGPQGQRRDRDYRHSRG